MNSARNLIDRKFRTDNLTKKVENVERAPAARSSKHKRRIKRVKLEHAQQSSEDVVMQQDNPVPTIDIPNLRFLRRVRREEDFGTKREKRQVVKVSENWFATDIEMLEIVWDYEVECDRPVGFPLDHMSFLQ
ncbi:hypothetical protein NW768_010191 [Fusarium equiseti]|uniref:Uncharacterized protein n=1 Tax=Fusarium equiseti TaxID=61235 RepID=A0ABQ8R121_FUSEQ|nr:hypothetical protein NW768_010191 [Fusarium equiseti]